MRVFTLLNVQTTESLNTLVMASSVGLSSRMQVASNISGALSRLAYTVQCCSK